MKTGILMAASGTANDEARAALDRIGEQAERHFPGMELRWSYTATAVRRRLAAEGTSVEAPATALKQMVADGFGHIAVGSLHVIAGKEFHDLARAVAETGAALGTTGAVSLGKPLLSSYDDLVHTASAVVAGLPPERTSEEAVVLIGHGNAGHPADLAYAAAGHAFSELDPLVFVGTVSGRPSLADILARCARSRATRAYLMPFTAVAGHTVRQVVDPSSRGSWAHRLEQAGVGTTTVMRGLVDYEGVAAVWLGHLREAVRMLDLPGKARSRP